MRLTYCLPLAATETLKSYPEPMSEAYRGRVPGVTFIRQGRQDPRPFGVALFWNAKYLDAEDPCTTNDTRGFHQVPLPMTRTST